MELKWTADLPTEPGWYWRHGTTFEPGPEIVRVVRGSDLGGAAAHDLVFVMVQVEGMYGVPGEDTGELWAGPIHEPAPEC